jgi:hypothetical protein
MPEFSTEQKLLERRLWRNSKEPSCLNGGLKIRRMQKFLGPKNDWMAWLQRFGLSLNALLGMSRVLNSKCPKPKASKDYLN